MKTNPYIVLSGAALVWGASVSGAGASEAQWPQFRGPGARGVATDPNLPERWSATENVAWQAPVPGRGWS